MRRYEEDRDPIPPGHGDRLGDPEPRPCCPVCGRLMRRRVEALKLSCDVHGMQTPAYERSPQQ